MDSDIDIIVDRQYQIATDSAPPLSLPRLNRYAVCNLRGGIGKTSLTFNLSYLTDKLLVADSCPQGNLSFFYDNQYYQNCSTTIYDMLLPYYMPGLGTATNVSRKIPATNQWFAAKKSFFVPSSDQLYVLPNQMANALVQARTVSGLQQQVMIDNMLYAFRKELDREMTETQCDKCLIDTSPFFAGATHLSWHAADALIIPVRTDQQSINSLDLLLNILSNPASEFRRVMPSNGRSPKIQMVVLTHCGWSTRKDARNEPNKQTKAYIHKLYDIVNRNINSFTTDDPSNHILLLDDFLGSGRISSALSMPIDLLTPGETRYIGRQKVEVNEAVNKVKLQLRYVSANIWAN